MRAFHPDDYRAIVRRHYDQITFVTVGSLSAEHLATCGPAATMVGDHEIVACGGIVKLWKGTGEAWLITSPQIERWRISFAKHAARMLNGWIEEFGFVRVQTVVDAEFETSQRWLERMGFVCEGIMKKYLGGRDFLRYARIKDW